MAKLGERIQSADWKGEKHVPVIECPDEVRGDEAFQVKATVGKAIAHPNTTAHHIRWIALYFQPEGEKFTCEVGRFEFGAHGESTKAPDEGPVWTQSEVSVSMKLKKAGTLHAVSLCNIHGLWESAKDIKVR